MALASASELRLYYYQVSEFYILNGSDMDEVETCCITSMEIREDFENDVFPVFKLSLALTKDRYCKIMNNKNTIKFKVRIQKFYRKPGSEDKSMMKDYISGTFVTIMDSSELDTDNKGAITNRTNQDSQTDTINTTMDLYLFREEVASSMKTEINQVLSGVNLTTAIGVIGSTGGLTNILMSPLENQQSYNQLMIPPLVVHKAIQYLDNQYGFYKAGSIIFFGLKNNYILNFKGGCTAYASGERQQTNLLILTKDNTIATESGMFDRNEKQYYVNWEIVDVHPNNNSITNDVLYGNNVNVVDSSTTGITKSTSSAISKGTNNTATIKNTTENQWMADTYTAQSNSESVVLTGALSNVDLDAFTPNKRFNVVFEDTRLTNKYKGIYFLTNIRTEFTNTGGVYFRAITSITLKRVSTDSTDSESYME